MRSLFYKLLLFILGISAVSCFDESKPNYQFMPNMYEEVSYEPYGSYDVFENGQEAKLPVEGTIPRGWRPYEYENTFDGYDAAKAELTNPLPYTEENIAAGKELYTIYCAVCHGDTGDGKGILVQREKFLGVPSYDDMGRAITEGSTYHVMYYGRNAMGSYASQTSIEERWQITHYVMSLKNKLEGGSERPFDVITEESVGENVTDTSGESGEMENLIPAVNAEGEINSGQSDQNGDQQNQIEE